MGKKRKTKGIVSATTILPAESWRSLEIDRPKQDSHHPIPAP